MQKSIYSFLIALLSMLINANAQKVYNLNDAVKTAIKNSYDIQLVENSLAIAKNNNDYGVAGALPNILCNA